jgi:hypothetical protein
MERRGSTRQGRVLVPAPLRIDDLGDSDAAAREMLVDTPHDKVPYTTPAEDAGAAPS